ncbi:hypothetical protein CCR91_07725 [Thiorhodovibrio winogradskyi]|nr:hypothetical protein [Thiorhodovibrio winogradskyi]
MAVGKRVDCKGPKRGFFFARTLFCPNHLPDRYPGSKRDLHRKRRSMLRRHPTGNSKPADIMGTKIVQYRHA